ncbi:hypothetical protein E2C01_063673 [Portunus trituberculatus]|uniref:Uncharacterized protein n=1 Tax=Portunus trituberculatus TaxID=210409 RepID=A0A5B7HL47_PORTR|nr:hypothetical protein [Portunus trituberculatus]
MGIIAISTNTPRITITHSHGLDQTSISISNPILPYQKLTLTSGQNL